MGLSKFSADIANQAGEEVVFIKRMLKFLRDSELIIEKELGEGFTPKSVCQSIFSHLEKLDEILII